MKKLHELLDKKLIHGDVGIEIECEGKNLKELNTALWRSEDDPSLRGRYPETRAEYVLQTPIPLTTVENALTELNIALSGSLPDFSFRTSVHVHVNILDLTEDQLLSYIYTYLLLEEVLFQYCGSSRKSNRFCLRLQDSDVFAKMLAVLFGGEFDNIFGHDEEAIRYAAINLYAIQKYGSVEFRGMRGTLDIKTLTVWATALVSIRNFACHQKDCTVIHDLYADLGPEKFLEHVLGDLASEFKYKKLVQDMNKSYSLTIDMPYKFHSRKEKVEKKVKVKKEPVPDNWIQFAVPPAFIEEHP